MSRLPPRPSATAAAVLALLFAAFLLAGADALRLDAAHEAARRDNRALVERLGLTDIALFNEARYTRHPTQADLHSAFQDHPLALEHFPSGSLLPPPRHEALDRTAARAD